MTASRQPLVLRELPLQALHRAHGARMESFAGWSMPIHYALGVLGEHRHTRSAAGLFDVSHMGQIAVRARDGDPQTAARALEALVPVDLVGVRPGRQRYALLTTQTGGVHDDLMIANLPDFWYLVVNAGLADSDFAYLEERLAATCTVEALSARALLAIQGPVACAALSALLPEAAAMRFMDARVCPLDGADCYVSRSGYTGEDGFEISAPTRVAESIASRLLQDPTVRLVGLGARDSLRLEAGLCLYGHDLDTETTPVEAALEWAIQPARRAGGARAGGFPGAEPILHQIAAGAPRRRIGLRSESRPVREGALLFVDATSTQAIGSVTSGTFGPSVPGPVAMGYVATAFAIPGSRLFADVRGQRVPVSVSDMPFVAHRYYR